MLTAMKVARGIILVFVLSAGCIREDAQVKDRTISNFSLTSKAFKQGDMIPSKYTCDGEDVSPPLSWGIVSDGTKTLTLIVDDPDAPRGIFTHWVLFNLPAAVTNLPEGVPRLDRLDSWGIQGKNDFGRKGYGGPCPPKRHTYRFILYALDIELNLKPGATRQEVLKAMEGHILARAELDGKYGK
ncbi:MAG: YbhB/YbcL family Raf kinase inhibitor-like protein [Candidatus Methanoperedens sp.]|nr:YbhB/YbcL family Raf kinase inhibitor-like protein [Candidatus Methanoperedens sp.]